ncbi:uncharacterized protein EKO05_0010537 [Ascochyta rabiei]|uniref:Uncharacterized protein n=1 Tax=Didymella rabiei TaxID=5454 RepID=A0A163KCG2_DIDRA|nr:uncharacterized protein EKO05_0010537 [Ascochyta rabiei]KZM26914.1 hypothetical protein ST47_g1941 [Ascochyta rabiei]UPX20301.1 hypothetical protein EKO05_0010537 [Ascochyta rabiei]
MTTSPADARNDPRNANLPLVNQPQTIIGTAITFLVLAIVAASLRLWSRVRDRLCGWDDAFVFLAGFASIAGESMVCLMPYDGLGLHFYTLSSSEKEAYFKHIWASNVAYCASTTFIKLAILFQYMRLFDETTTSTTSSRYHLARKCIWSVIIISAMWGFSFFILALFPCQPIAKNWNPTLPGKCVGWGTKDPDQFFRMWVAQAATNMFLDIIVLLLPLPFLGILRLAGKSRAALIALFALGGVVAVMSIGRMVSLCIDRAGTVPVLDMSYHTPVVFIFSILEVNIAILCASIPTFWPIISSFAANRILVVNEVLVHVEEYPKPNLDGQPGIGLAEQGAWKSLPESPGVQTQQPSRLGAIVRKFDQRPSKEPHAGAKHKNKSSVASSVGKALTRPELNGSAPRSSQESQHILYPATSRDSTSLTKSDYDWFAELDRDCVGK